MPYLPVDPANLFYCIGSIFVLYCSTLFSHLPPQWSNVFPPLLCLNLLSHKYTHTFSTSSHLYAHTHIYMPTHTHTYTHTHMHPSPPHRHACFWPPHYAHRPQDTARDIRHALYVHYRPPLTTLEPPRFENSSAYVI